MPLTIVLVTILKPNHFFKIAKVRGPEGHSYRLATCGQGKKLSEVARAMGENQQAISALAKMFRATRTVNDLPRTGRPRETTEREDLIIIATAMENSFFSDNNLKSI